MTISTGNYESWKGVNRVSFPARTVDGESVMIEEKITRANQSTILVAEDGRTFEAAAGDSMNLVEIVLDRIEGVVEEAVEKVEETVGDAVEGVKDAVGDAVESVGDAAGEVLDSIQDALGGGNEEEPVPGLKPDDPEAA